MNLKKLTISNLIFLLNNQDKQNKVYEELKNRFNLYPITLNKFIDKELNIINERGNDLESYLFKPNPTLQELIELYFSSFSKDTLLFSETHLVNLIDDLYINIDKEIDRLDNKISTNTEALIIVKNKLLLKKEKINKNDTKKYLLKYSKNNNTLLKDFYINSLIKSDDRKLKLQKLKLLKEYLGGYKINYETDNMKKILSNMNLY